MEFKSNIKIKKVTGKEGDSFYGIKISGDDVIIFCPETLDIKLNSDCFRKDVLLFLKSLSLAKTKDEIKSKVNDENGQMSTFPINSYLWIIKDFLSNGLYLIKDKIHYVGYTGKINWKKTIKQRPLISNGNIIYSPVIVDDCNIRSGIITEIHKYCIKVSLKNIGWLYKLSPELVDSHNITKSIIISYINILQKEINVTFNDRKKELIIHMLNILKSSENLNDDGLLSYGIYNYYYVFERMINAIFGTEENLDKYCPDSEWILEFDKSNRFSASKLHPDSILKTDNAIFVIDSKFYRFGYTSENNDLPNTSSIQKQITYAEYIEMTEKEKKIYNVFILPYSKEHGNLHDKYPNLFTENLEYLGCSKSHWKSNDKCYHTIHTYLIDLKHVLYTWESLERSDDVDCLTKTIEEKAKIANN